MSRIFKCGALAGLVALVTVGVFAHAAGGGAKVEAEDFSIDEIELFGEGFATCPGSKRVVGGGAVGLQGETVAFLGNSGPLDSTGTTAETVDGDVATQWYANGQRSGAPGEQSYRVIGLCSKSSDAKVEASTFTPSTPYTRRASSRRGGFVYGSGTAECEGKRRVVGGGVVVSGSIESLLLLASGPLDGSGKASKTKDGDTPKQWYAAVEAFAPAPPHKVFALCSADSKATIEATKKDLDPSELITGSVKCRGKDQVTGGGMVQFGDEPFHYLRESGPLDNSGEADNIEDGDKVTQWYTAVQSQSASSANVGMFAICE